MDKLRQIRLLETALDKLLELSECPCYSADHFREAINLLRKDIADLDI